MYPPASDYAFFYGIICINLIYLAFCSSLILWPPFFLKYIHLSSHGIFGRINLDIFLLLELIIDNMLFGWSNSFYSIYNLMHLVLTSEYYWKNENAWSYQWLAFQMLRLCFKCFLISELPWWLLRIFGKTDLCDSNAFQIYTSTYAYRLSMVCPPDTRKPLPAKELCNAWGKPNPVLGKGALGNSSHQKMYHQGDDAKSLVCIVQTMLTELGYDIGSAGIDPFYQIQILCRRGMERVRLSSPHFIVLSPTGNCWVQRNNFLLYRFWIRSGRCRPIGEWRIRF